MEAEVSAALSLPVYRPGIRVPSSGKMEALEHVVHEGVWKESAVK